jgi:hypothetical protein
MLEEILCLKIMSFRFTVQNDLNRLATDVEKGMHHVGF